MSMADSSTAHSAQATCTLVSASPGNFVSPICPVLLRSPNTPPTHSLPPPPSVPLPPPILFYHSIAGHVLSPLALSGTHGSLIDRPFSSNIRSRRLESIYPNLRSYI